MLKYIDFGSQLWHAYKEDKNITETSKLVYIEIFKITLNKAKYTSTRRFAT